MFYKYASNLLQDIQSNCVLKAYTLKNADDRDFLLKIADRLESLIQKIGVETPGDGKTDLK